MKAGTVDIKLKVKEKGKQSISFNGGVSGIAGAFIGLSYQTNNFLGLGETLTLSAQIGRYSERACMFGFTEPYLFRPADFHGLHYFREQFDYNQARQEGLCSASRSSLNPALQQNYTTNSKGLTVFASYPLRRLAFTRMGITYGWTATKITAFSQSASFYLRACNLPACRALRP